MTIGAGVYDDICTEVRERLKANGLLLIVIGGDRGSGFSCQGDLRTILALPDTLEFIAKQIREDGP